MHPADAILDILSASERVLLTGPIGPDGDSIGACLAMARVLRERGVDVVVAGRPPPRYQFLDGVRDMVDDSRIAGPFPAVAVLDGDRHRLEPNVAAAFAAAPVRAIVDHHGSSTPEGYTHAWLEPTTESTCGMLLRSFRRWGIPIDRSIAELLFTGIVFDTGAFRHPNTSPELLRLSADLLATGIDHGAITVKVLSERSRPGLGVMGRVLSTASFDPQGVRHTVVGRVPLPWMQELVDGDLEGIIEALLNTWDTELAVLLVERASSVKFSLRSRRTIDVAGLARRLHPTGGGHPRAAGATFHGSLEDAERHLLATLAEVETA